jgi:hypothetical protein
MSRAAGEFAVIVLGVLVALFMEGAWEDWKERRLAETYIERLQVETAHNRTAIGNDRRMVDLMCPVGESLHRELNGLSESPDSLLLTQAFVVALHRARSDRTSTYQDLVATGRLALLDDADLRSSLLGYYEGALGNFEAWRPSPQEDLYRQSVLRTLPPEWTSDLVVCLRSADGELRSDWEACAGAPEEGAAPWLQALRNLPEIEAHLADRVYDLCNYGNFVTVAAQALDSLDAALVRAAHR